MMTQHCLSGENIMSALSSTIYRSSPETCKICFHILGYVYLDPLIPRHVDIGPILLDKITISTCVTNMRHLLSRVLLACKIFRSNRQVRAYVCSNNILMYNLLGDAKLPIPMRADAKHGAEYIGQSITTPHGCSLLNEHVRISSALPGIVLLSKRRKRGRLA